MTGILVPGNLPENQVNFFSLDLEKSFSIFVLVSKHKIYRKIFSFSSRKMRFSVKFLEKFFRQIDKLTDLFSKILVNRQAINVIL